MRHLHVGSDDVRVDNYLVGNNEQRQARSHSVFASRVNSFFCFLQFGGCLVSIRFIFLYALFPAFYLNRLDHYGVFVRLYFRTIAKCVALSKLGSEVQDNG